MHGRKRSHALQWLAAAVLAAVCAGCITIEYSRFRGRWWNYYERGCSSLDSERWGPAEQDFRTALARRRTDGLWARTYGLHFLPEYFPHRELGVALYHQGRIEEAIEELETSLEQFHSARAAFHLGRARLADIQAKDLDKENPTFEVLSPFASSPVGATKAELRGVARDDTYVASIHVDGEVHPIKVSAPEVEFSHPIRLQPGRNTFTVTIEDLLGNRTEDEVIVESDVDGPAVSFDTPVVLPGTIQGVAMDRAGVAAMRIAEKPATLTEESGGLVRFAIDLDLAEAEPPLRYECEDSYANTTSGALPVDMITFARLPQSLQPASLAPPMLIPLGQGLNAVVVSGQMVAVAKDDVQQADEEPEIEISTPQPGFIYHEEEIAVGVEIRSPKPIRLASINGLPVDVIPGRAYQTRSRRLPLREPRKHQVVAKLVDRDGTEASHQIEVERRLSKVEEVGRLRVAFVDYRSENQESVKDDVTAGLEGLLSRELDNTERFGEVLDRDPGLIGSIIAEQELSTYLASRRNRLALLQLLPAEVLLVTSVYWHADTVEIILEGKSTELVSDSDGLTIARADVEGMWEGSGGLKELVHLLALEFIQKLPRVQGRILDIRGATRERIITELAAQHRVRRNLKLVVFRYGEPILDPDTGEIIVQEDTEILGEALLSRVAEESSDARMLKRSEDYPDEPIEKGYFVVTK